MRFSSLCLCLSAAAALSTNHELGSVAAFSSASRVSLRRTSFVKPNGRNTSRLHVSEEHDPSFRQTSDASAAAASVAASASAEAPMGDGMASHRPIGEAIRRLGLGTGPTVWTEFGRLAQEHDPVNLGQGFPDWLPPKFAVDSLVEAVLDSAQSPHQYTRPAGHPNLVRQLARRYSIHMNNRHIDPMTDVAVTVGASQALYLSLQTLVRPGDEVILFEPFFDLYVNQVKLAGGKPVFVPLTFVPYEDDDGEGSENVGGEWKLDRDAVRQAVSPRTKAIILNSPHNPTGKIFTRTEMEYIAESLELAGPECVVLSDEVYKYIVHSPPKEPALGESPLCRGHTHFASLPGMWDRTITISSAGKTFSATGWQVGWCIGPQHLIAPIHQLLPYVQFCASTVIQEALARSLPRADEPYEGHDSYYEYLKAKYLRKRDLLADALTEAGFAVPDYTQTAGGGFFIFARIGQDIANMIPPKYLNSVNAAAPGGVVRQDWALCQWMAEEVGLLCIPSTPFFSPAQAEAGASDRFIRVAFCKNDATIEAAAAVLRKMVGATDKETTLSVNHVATKENTTVAIGEQ